ncbi:MAG: hypothetical protein IKH84_07685, partial [Ottowia sp.]|nr:hypothetical protein [Ottowia sp.]
MKNRMRWKTPLALVLAAQLVGCVWIGDMLSKYVATVPQSAGVQEVDKTLDVFGEHEIMFVFHGYDCSVPLPGHADIEVTTLAGKKLAEASFPLKELIISGVGAIKTEEEQREEWLEEQRKCNKEPDEQEWKKMFEGRQKM